MHDPTPSSEAEAILASIKQRLEQIADWKGYVRYADCEEYRNQGRVDLAQDLLDEFFS